MLSTNLYALSVQQILQETEAYIIIIILHYY